MQTIMELLTSPGDIVLNWAVGEGCAYPASKLSNWYIAGMESWPTIYSLAQHQLPLVQNPLTLRNKRVEDVGGWLSKPISIYDESDSGHEGQRHRPRPSIQSLADQKVRRAPMEATSLKGSE
jgi:hypothetical protein